MAVMNDTALLMNGFKVVAKYYRRDGAHMTFWTGNGQIFVKETKRKRVPYVRFFSTALEANNYFKERQATCRQYGGDEWRREQ